MVERAGGGERGIFAERMAGDETRVARDVEPGFRLENAGRGETDRHQRGLRIGGQRQLGLGTLEHQPGQILPERAVDLGEDLPRRRIGLGERLAHADRLRPLPWKHESRQHRRPFVVGAETMLGAGCQERRRSARLNQGEVWTGGRFGRFFQAD